MVLLGKPDRKRRCIWEDNIKSDFKSNRLKDVDRIYLARARDWWKARVNTVMRFHVPLRISWLAENFLTSEGVIDRADVEVTLYTLIREVLGSNPVRDARYSDLSLSWFCSVPPNRCLNSTTIWTCLLPSKSCEIRHSSIIIQFGRYMVWLLVPSKNSPKKWALLRGIRNVSVPQFAGFIASEHPVVWL
jgi:hypothetical protein